LGKQRLAALQVIWHLLRAQREVVSAAPNADHPLKPSAAAQYYTNRIGRTGRESRTKRQHQNIVEQNAVALVGPGTTIMSEYSFAVAL
jgi:hypothetical protein